MTITLQIKQIVKSTAASIDRVNKLYGDIIKGMQQRKLMRIKIEREALRLRSEEVHFIEQCAREMARALGFKNVNQIHERTGHPLITLKILLSLFRRVRTLVEYQERGKVDLDPDRDKLDE